MFADVLTNIVTMLGVKVLNALAAQGIAVPLLEFLPQSPHMKQDPKI